MKATLSAILECRIKEVADVIEVYRRLVELDDPMRTLLLSRAIAALHSMQALEAMPNIPPAEVIACDEATQAPL